MIKNSVYLKFGKIPTMNTNIYCDNCNHITVAKSNPGKCDKCGSEDIHQDEDTLDTWFSSALWPFST